MAKSSNGNKLTQIIMMKTFNFTQLPSIGRNSTLLAYISIQLPPPPKHPSPVIIRESAKKFQALK